MNRAQKPASQKRAAKKAPVKVVKKVAKRTVSTTVPKRKPLSMITTPTTTSFNTTITPTTTINRTISTKTRLNTTIMTQSNPIQSLNSLTFPSFNLSSSSHINYQSKRGIKCNADELRAGSLIKWGPENKLFKVISLQHKMMGRRPTSLSVDLKCLATNKLFPTRFMPADTVERVELDMKWYDFLYAEGEIGVIMDNETFEQIEFPAEMLGKDREWIPTDCKLQCTFYEGALFSIIPPDNVVFEVKDEDNNINSRVNIANYKNVFLTNGQKLAVPEFIKVGDKVRVKLDDHTFMLRANE